MKEGYKEVRLGIKKLIVPDYWEKFAIEDKINIVRGYAFKSKDYVKKGIFVLRVSNIKKNGYINLEKEAKFLPDFYYKKYQKYKLCENDILLVMVGASTGKIGLVDKSILPALLNQNMWNLKIKSRDIDKHFFYFQMLNEIYRFLNMRIGSARSYIKQKDFKKFMLILPPLPEQKKIAAILSSVDAAIEKTDAIIDKTKQLKKGLMQKLLTKGIGHSEFKEVRLGPKTLEIPKTWEIYKIGFLTKKFLSGGTPSTKNKKYWGGKVHWITGANIRNRLIDEGKTYITKKGLKNSSSNLVPAGNVILCTRTAVGNIGKNLIDIAISQDITGLILKRNLVDVDYFVWMMINFKYLLRLYQQGSTIKGITRNVLKNFEFPLPPLPEQKQIAAILISVDNKIQTEQSYKEQLEKLKKGLMQKLLTGEVRVKVASNNESEE